MDREKCFVSGNDAVALGVRLARPNVIAAYPITPQTIVVERLSDFCEDGSLKAEFMHVESEHSALSACMGASSVGARTFTATSSQGLLYMAECLYYTAGGRWPVVMMNANRSLALPWSIYGDLSDSLSQLNSGWIQVYVEDAQEALDMVIQGFKIAENNNVLTPFMINLDGFILTHTYELIEIPSQEMVDNFLPPFEAPNKLCFESPKNLGMSTSPADNMEYKYQQHLALLNSREVIEEVDKEFGEVFNRFYGGMIDKYYADDAEVILITVGSVTGTARLIVDKLRLEGKKVGLVKIRYMRPFPEKEIIDIASKVKAIGVVDKDISFGYEGTIFTNVNSSITNLEQNPKLLNFICGMGGRNVSKEHIENMFNSLFEAANGVPQERIQFIGLGVEVDG